MSWLAATAVAPAAAVFRKSLRVIVLVLFFTFVSSIITTFGQKRMHLTLQAAQDWCLL
jgi:hypothetical protein